MPGRILLYASVALLAVLFVLRLRHGSDLRPAPRIAAPDFTLPDLEGRRVALSSLHGRPVLVNFWATWCGPCRAELPDLEELSRDQPGCLAVLGVAVNSGSAADVAAFSRQRGITYPVLIDDGSAGSAYRVVSIPHSVLIDPDGRQVGTFSGGVTAVGVKDALRALGNEPVRC